MKRIITLTIICALAHTAFAQNFGIDQPSPAEKLDVNGNIKASGFLRLGNAFNLNIPNTCGGNWITNSDFAIFTTDHTGGCGDEAYFAHYIRSGEATTLEIANKNDGDDHIALMPSGNVGIGNNAPGQKLDVNGNIRMAGSTFVGNGSSSSYGASTVQGETNGWGGFSFRRANGSFLGTFMIHEDYSGVYNNADNGWDWYWTNGTLSAGTVPLSNVWVNGGGTYRHLGTWSGPWNAADGVLVNGALFWHGASPSDRNIKKNINPLADAELKALSNKLMSIPLYNYQFIEDPVSEELIHIGMMADEVPAEMQMPGKHSINAMNGIMMSVAAIKVLQKENEQLKARLTQIEKQIGNK